VELAAQVNLPVIVHTREADEDTAAILREIRPAKGVLHCFTSGRALAETALDLGLLISFSGIVTFPKAGDLAAIARDIPGDRLLVETDCPYLAPVPYRGKRNEPAFVSETARFLANVRGMDTAEFLSQTFVNFSRLFSLPESA
jgi:TatD DNase family protein